MSDERRTLHHNLTEAVQGERIVKSLEIAAKRLKDVRLHTVPVITHRASGQGSELKVYREPTLTWRGMSVKVTTSEQRDIAAIAPFDRVMFDFGRELTPEEVNAFGEVLNQLDIALKESPETKGVAVRAGTPSGSQSQASVKTETEVVEFSEERKYCVLALVQGEFGKRKVKNIKERGPPYWVVEAIELPVDLPTVIDDPAEFLEKEVPKADLLLALQENANAAQLIVDYVKLSGAKALLAPVDTTEWLPEGQRNQIHRQLRALGVECAFPRPFCVFEECGNLYLDEFAKYFGKPVFKIQWERDNVTDVQIVRGAPCGCSVFVADKLKGVRVDESPEIAGLAHHHYPCLASMTREPDLDDTLMHKSGFKTKEAVDKEIEPYKRKRASYLDPSGLK